jgi:hypothetical protein
VTRAHVGFARRPWLRCAAASFALRRLVVFGCRRGLPPSPKFWDQNNNFFYPPPPDRSRGAHFTRAQEPQRARSERRRARTSPREAAMANHVFSYLGAGAWSHVSPPHFFGQNMTHQSQKQHPFFIGWSEDDDVACSSGQNTPLR